MKYCKIFTLLFSLFWISSCENVDEPLLEGDAEITINVASRGGYQFLINFDNGLYYPENLPEEFKVVSQEPIPVQIKFQLLNYKEDIFYPGSNDVPLYLRSIPAIRLLAIEKEP